jgi:hypothetical protein
MREINFARNEHFWDNYFQLMKHGTNILQVAFIFFVQYAFFHNKVAIRKVGVSKVPYSNIQ